MKYSGPVFLIIGCLLNLSLLSHAIAKPIPVILDTDIGVDIDDTWALSLILCSPELDLKLVVSDSHDTVGKAKVAAKFLEKVGRSDIPIGIGIKKDDIVGPQWAWVKNYDLDKYPGKVHQDGVQALIDTLKASVEPMVLIVLGPCPNIEDAFKRAPEVIKQTRFVAMSGSVKLGYDGVPSPDAEFNVRDAISASKVMYRSAADLTIAPLDTAGLVSLKGEKYQKLLHQKNILIDTLLENYRIWQKEGKAPLDTSVRSSVLFDTVAIYLTFADSFCEMQDLHLQVDDKGYTVIDPAARIVHTAMKWKDMGKFEDFLVQRLIQGPLGVKPAPKPEEKKK